MLLSGAALYCSLVGAEPCLGETFVLARSTEGRFDRSTSAQGVEAKDRLDDDYDVLFTRYSNSLD